MISPAALLPLLLALPAPAAASPSAASSAAESAARADYLRGTLLERQGAYAEALAAFEAALAHDPGSAFLAGEAAELALEVRDWERAERWARRRLELAPADAQSKIVLARVLWARGAEEEALSAFEEALDKDPASLDAALSLVELLAPRRPERARAVLERFLKANPDHAARVLHELGKLDAQEGRYAKAVERLKKSIALDDAESGGPRLTLAQVYEATRATAAALGEYRRLLADQPDDWELWAHIAELEAARGDLDAARAEFSRLLEKKPGDPAACSWLASDAERAGEFARAAGLLRASDALPGDPTLNLRLGYYELQSAGAKAAMRTLREARKRWPKDDRIAYYLALGHDDLGERAEAIALLREVLAVKPEDRDARWQLATILEKAGRMAEAEDEFKRLIGERPDDAAALNYLAYAWADRGMKLAEAEILARRALEIEPANAAYRDTHAWALFKLGLSTRAVEELESAVRSLPDDESVWEHLGDARRAAGDEDGAWAAWRMAQGLGAEGAGAKADALQKGLPAEAAGELWRRRLAAVQGGVRRLTGLCELRGRVAGKDLSRRALFTFRAPDAVDFELLGPLFSTAWRARLDSKGFAMDALPVDGIDEKKVEEAVRGAFTAAAAALSGRAFEPGPARYESSWGRSRLERPGWRVELEDALARVVEPAAGGSGAELSDFARAGARQIPRAITAKGRFWSLTIACPEPKVEFDRAASVPEAP